MRMDLGLDLGSYSARMVVSGASVPLVEANLAMVRGDRICVLGEAAGLALGRTPQGMRPVRPVVHGSVEDMAVCVELIRSMMARVMGSPMTRRPVVGAALPGSLRDAEKRALTTAILESGAEKVALVPSALCAALGAGWDIASPEGIMVVELGDGVMAASVVAGGMVSAQLSLPLGMGEVDGAIQRALRAEGFEIGPRTAEDLKQTLGAAFGGRGTVKQPVIGLDRKTGFPVSREVSAECVNAAIAPIPQRLIRLVNELLPGLSGELSADLAQNGMLLTGGGAALFGIEKLMANETGLNCQVASDPAGCAIRGLEALLGKPELLERIAIPGRPLVGEKR